jgi:hypothetical protein
MLQNYIAACTGIEVGPYHQISSNLHVYTNNWDPARWLEYNTISYRGIGVTWGFPLKMPEELLHQECVKFAEHEHEETYTTKLLELVCKPLAAAHAFHKQRKYDKAFSEMDKVVAIDWQLAGREWLQRRRNKWERDNAPNYEEGK